MAKDTQITVLFSETVPVLVVERRDAGCRTCCIRGATPPKSQAEADARLVLVRVVQHAWGVLHQWIV